MSEGNFLAPHIGRVHVRFSRDGGQTTFAHAFSNITPVVGEQIEIRVDDEDYAAYKVVAFNYVKQYMTYSEGAQDKFVLDVRDHPNQELLAVVVESVAPQ